jgi:insecticidal toxin complex protein TccC
MLPVDGATGDLHPLPRYPARNKTDLAAMKIQAMVRGTQAREHVSVRTVADGVIHTRLRGDSATFARVGIESLNTDNGPKMLDVLALRSDKFQGHVVGGDRLYVNVLIDKDKRQHSYGSVLGRKLPKQLLHVYINGGYFNVQRWADKHKSPHVPIGDTVSIGGKPMDSIPVPQHYRNRYTSISFEDKSMVTCGPVLSEKGLTTFNDKDLLNPDYQFQNKIIKPGELNHAQHPNPRSAMSIPDTVSPQDSYRLAVATTPDQKRGSEGTGFTMPEWSRVAARFDRMNQSPGLSINLDGGASSTMGMIGQNSER